MVSVYIVISSSTPSVINPLSTEPASLSFAKLQSMKTLRLLFLLASLKVCAQNDYFFPSGVAFDPAIPTPEQFLGYPIGNWHTRHDRIVAYFQELAKVSPKARLQVIGYTYEHRPQVVLTITSTDNHQKIDDIRKEHLRLAQSITERECHRYAGDRNTRLQCSWQ